jgi:hypothetical protein
MNCLDYELARFEEEGGVARLTPREAQGYWTESEIYKTIKGEKNLRIKTIGLRWYTERRRHKYDFKIGTYKLDIKCRLGDYHLSRYLGQNPHHDYDAIVLFVTDLNDPKLQADEKYCKSKGIKLHAIAIKDWLDFNKHEMEENKLRNWLRQEFNKPRILRIWTEGIDWIKAKARFNKHQAGNGNGSTKFNKQAEAGKNTSTSKTESNNKMNCNTMSGKEKEDHKEEEDEVDHILYFGDNVPDECRCKVGEFNKTKHCVTCSPRCFMAWMLSSYCLSHKPLAKTTTGSGELL